MSRSYGLIGARLSYSYSQIIHEAIFRIFGVRDARYDLIEQSELRLPDHFDGLNITIPYKESVIAHLDAVDPVAAALRSVNTVVAERGAAARRKMGHNTDYLGFEYLLPREIGSYRAATVLGTGASARMARFVLTRRGVSGIEMISRVPGRGDATYEDLARRGVESAGGVRPALLVNATPVGTSGEPPGLRIDARILSRFDHVVDLVYNPKRTELIRAAEERGIRTAGGLDMLIVQAVEAQILWGTAPPGAVSAALIEQIKEELSL